MDPSSVGRCGDRLAFDVGAVGPLHLSASFPSRLPGGGDGLFRGTVTVTNRGDVRFSGLSAAAADVYVTLAGRIVATPVDKEDSGQVVELAPGADRRIPATGRLRQCAVDGSGDSDATPAGSGKPLAPGGYEVYASLSLTEAPDGRPLLVAGGPWPLQVA